jgi:hypothetical protein
MLRKTILGLALTLAVLATGVGPAQAGGWESINDRSGHSRVTVRAWTRGYNQVAFTADHAGTRISVDITVDCADGYHFDNTWNDGGRRFVFRLRGLADNGRCNHTFRARANDSFPRLDLTVWGR